MTPLRLFRIAARCELGMSLVETLVALAILGTTVVTFLSGVTISSKAALTTDEQTTAESLAQTQMEWAQNATYTVNATQYSPAPIPDGDDFLDYSAGIAAQPLDTPDAGIQKIIVTVNHSGTQVFTLEGYKVNR